MSIELSLKHPSIESALKSLFPKRGTGVCVFCETDKVNYDDFKDDLSRSEFSISSMCQVCQDDFYGPAEG